MLFGKFIFEVPKHRCVIGLKNSLPELINQVQGVHCGGPRLGQRDEITLVWPNGRPRGILLHVVRESLGMQKLTHGLTRRKM